MQKILDLGCGNDKQGGAFGVDIDKKSQADMIYDLNEFPYPFETNSYETVFSKYVIEHLENPLEFLKECKRIAINKVVVITDNQTSLHYIFDGRQQSVEHLFAWNDHNIIKLFKRTGFEDVEVRYNKFKPDKWTRVFAFLLCRIMPVFNPDLIVEAKLSI